MCKSLCVCACVEDVADKLGFIKHLLRCMHYSERFKTNFLLTILGGRFYLLAHFKAAESKTRCASNFFRVSQLLNARAGALTHVQQT